MFVNAYPLYRFCNEPLLGSKYALKPAKETELITKRTATSRLAIFSSIWKEFLPIPKRTTIN
jgi:hypothetical protein